MLKNQALEYEKQKVSNIRTIQGEYSEFLNNQMKEKQITEDLQKHEKSKYHNDIKLKYQILAENEKRDKLERMQNQVEYRGMLNEQERFRSVHPERALKINESPQRSEGSLKAQQMMYAQQPHHSLASNASATSIGGRQVPSQNVEPVGPVNANIGHKSEYIGPNPILAPVSDPLYNPYVRREVTNSLHDPRKKSIYTLPTNIASYNQMSNVF
jgi:hypothetical protein